MQLPDSSTIVATTDCLRNQSTNSRLPNTPTIPLRKVMDARARQQLKRQCYNGIKLFHNRNERAKWFCLQKHFRMNEIVMNDQKFFTFLKKRLPTTRGGR